MEYKKPEIKKLNVKVANSGRDLLLDSGVSN